jgi:O-antigen/teichoic acid export membrane protein
MLVNLYTTRVVLDVLGVSDYGVYNVVCGFVSMFGVLNTSLSNGVQRFYNYELGKGGERALVKVFNTSIVIQTILAITLLILLETIGVWYLNTQMDIPLDRMEAANYILQFSIISLIFVVLQVPYSAAIIAYERMDYYAIISIMDVFIKLIVVVIIPYLGGDKLIIYGLLLSFVGLLNYTLYYGYCKRNFTHLKFHRTFDRNLFKTMFTFSGWNLLDSFAYMMKGQGVNVLLNTFFGTIVNAANGIATQVSFAIQSLALNLTLAFKPQLTQSYAQGGYTRTESLMFSMSKISYLFVCIISIPVLVDLHFILELWLGENIPDYTITFTRLTIITMIISVLNTPITQVIHATGKMKRYHLTSSCIICCILPVSWIFLKLGFTAETVFYVGIVLTIINQIVSTLILRTVFKYSIYKYLREVILFCGLILPVPILVSNYIYNLFPDGITRLIIIFLTSTIFICASAIVLLNKDEKRLILSVVHNLFKK